MSAPVGNAPPAPNRIVGATAIVAATGALACGVCCVLPFALPAAIVALTGGVMAWWGNMMPLVRAVAAVAVAGGWLWVGGQSLRTRRRPATSTIMAMILATGMLAGALAWPSFESEILELVRGQ